MAGPVFYAAGTRTQSGSAASLSPAKPGVLGQSGMLLAVVTSKNNGAHTTATPGWTQLGTNINSGASFTASLWTAAESAGTPTFTWTGAAACSAQIAYYVDPNSAVSATLGATTSNTGLTTPHSTSAIVSTVNLNLAVYVDVAALNAGLAIPAGWTEDSDAGSGTDAGETTFGSLPLATSGTSSGAISVAGANAAWVQWQVEVKEVAATPGFQVSKAEVGAWYEPPAGLDVSKAEVGAWYEPPAGLDVSKAEVGAWYEPPAGFDTSKVEVGAWLDVAPPVTNFGNFFRLMRR